MIRAKPFTDEELEDFRTRMMIGHAVPRLLATIDERDKKIAKLIDELHYLRSLCQEQRPTRVINFWLNKSLSKFEPSKTVENDQSLAPELVEEDSVELLDEE